MFNRGIRSQSDCILISITQQKKKKSWHSLIKILLFERESNTDNLKIIEVCMPAYQHLNEYDIIDRIQYIRGCYVMNNAYCIASILFFRIMFRFLAVIFMIVNKVIFNSTFLVLTVKFNCNCVLLRKNCFYELTIQFLKLVLRRMNFKWLFEGIQFFLS